MTALWAVLLFLAGGLVGHCVRHLRCCEKRIALLDETRSLLDEAKLYVKTTEENMKDTELTLKAADESLAKANALFTKEKEEGDRLLLEIRELHRSETERLAEA